MTVAAEGVVKPAIATATVAAATPATTTKTATTTAAATIVATASVVAEVVAPTTTTTITTVDVVTPRTTPKTTTTTATEIDTPTARRAKAHAVTTTPTAITAPTRIPQASSAAADAVVVPFLRSASMRLRSTKGAGDASAASAAAGVSHSTRAHLNGSTTSDGSKTFFGGKIAKIAHYRSWSNLGQRKTAKAKGATATSLLDEAEFHAQCLALTEQPTELQFLADMEAKSRNMVSTLIPFRTYLFLLWVAHIWYRLFSSPRRPPAFPAA